jgi:RNA ligase
MLEVAKRLQHNEEGFVVRFSNGFRLKIKGDEYVRVHRLISNCTPLRIWESMMACDNIDLIRKDLPEEMHKDFDVMTSILREKFDVLLEQIKQCYESTLHLSDKELGLLLNSRQHTLPEEAKNFIFLCRKQNFLEEVHNPNRLRRRAFATFRPEKNQLEGYVSSSVMNRFLEASDS